MDLKAALTDYEIGGIGDIKKHTLRFHSYRMGTEGGKLMIYGQYEPGQLPKVYKGYPSGQELLLDLCNLHLELRGKTLQESASVLIRWSMENVHPYYYYGDDASYMEYSAESPENYWDHMVNVLELYHVAVEDMVRDLDRLYIDTMTVFAVRKLMDGDVAEAQRLYENVRAAEQDNLMFKWFRTPIERRALVIKEVVDKLPKLSMRLEYDLADGQLKLQPAVRSVIDAAYYGLSRFAAVDVGALDDYGGKTNIAFCQACGRAFIKTGNRQKYCGDPLCQSIRNKRKSSDYYYRKKQGEQ